MTKPGFRKWLWNLSKKFPSWIYNTILGVYHNPEVEMLVGSLLITFSPFWIIFHTVFMLLQIGVGVVVVSHGYYRGIPEYEFY